jgi:ribosomal protein S18 acetylase RimI-like enzyme
MQLNFKSIVSKDDPVLERVLTLYLGCFPPQERRDGPQLKALLGNPEMCFSAIHQEKNLVGFIICWNFTTFCFIEHFAIFPHFRRKKIGSQALKLLSCKGTKILLESEKPHDEISEHRLSFYLSNGFHILDIGYFQPPYRKGEEMVPMFLISDTTNWEEKELQSAIELIQDKVYYQNYLS